MEKGQIRRLKKELSEELLVAETNFIRQAEENTDEHINSYSNLQASFEGRYVCSDLFKETFPEYIESIETRKKYAEVVHNSAAVLANELFHRNVKNSEIKKCIFLSGVPGAGKSFLIQSLLLAGAVEKDTMLYEGDISSPAIFEKMDAAVQNGIELYVIIVNPTLELAQRNAINRHFEIGRGASSQTMARIMSRIPEALNAIKERYPDIELGIYDKKTNYDIDYYSGFENIELLNHGTYEEILEQLLVYRDTIMDEIMEDLKKKSNFLKKDESEEISVEKR